ncbi:hypothetical protein BDQ12DRAFT_22747 [Crucibulum laeve]|uniref:Uncharacterized protein n=1 Tax=Crucibulum laeve TaxID=68775 RepID=A0A5C3MJE6_9AGAR|nr:hypothetical protein BDQ12DRAFT_22747 [Crucibulum laeve]
MESSMETSHCILVVRSWSSSCVATKGFDLRRNHPSPSQVPGTSITNLQSLRNANRPIRPSFIFMEPCKQGLTDDPNLH